MSGEGNNFDLQNQALKEFELKDVQELLKQLKTSNNLKLTEDILKKLDKNNNSLSETEKKLYEQSQEALDIVIFLEGLVKSLEKKEEKKIQFGGTFGAFKNTSAKLNKETYENINLDKELDSIITLENSKKDKDGLSELEENIPNLFSKNKIQKIENKEKILLNYFKNRPTKLKIIIETGNLALTGLCSTKKISSFEKDLKNMYIENKKEKIQNILKGYKSKDGKEINIEELFKSEACKAINLIEKLKGLKGPNGEKLDPNKIKQILDGTITIKENKTLTELKEILTKYSITKKDLEGKTLKEINKILTNKEVSKEDKKTILEKLNNLKVIKEARNISIEDIQNILSFGLEGYNYFSNEYYLKNTSETIKISDKKKFLEVSSFLKENNKTLNFYNLSNPSFRTDFNLIKDFQEISGKKLNYFETKDIDFSKLENKEKIELLDIVDEENLKNILLQNKEDIKNLNNKKYIKISNEILNNKTLSEDLTYEEDNIKIDNSLSKLFKEDYKKALIVFEDLNYGSDKILELPKTKEIIFKNPQIINYFINQDFHFYDILSQKLQKIHNLKYIESVLEKSDNKSRDLAKLQFSDIKNLLIAFNKIKKYSKINDPFLITKIIQRPIFKLTLKKIYTEQSDNIKTLKPQDKERLGKIMGEFEKYDEENKRFIKIYNESQIEKNIPKENINNNKDNIFSIKGKEIGNLIMTFSENGFDEIQSKIADIIKDYIKNPSNIKSIFNNEIASKLGEKKYKVFLKELKKIIDSYFSIPINDLTKEEKKGINEKYINKNTGEIIYKNFKIDYLEKLKNTKIKYQKNNQKFDEKEFTKKYVEENFPNLLEKNKVKLINKILYENIGEKKLNKTINNDNLIKATVNGNQDYINKYLKDIDNKFYNDIEEEISEYKKQKESELNSIENKPIVDNSYNINFNSLPSEITENNTIEVNGKTIDNISSEEYKQLKIENGKIGNPEALKNLVDTKEKLHNLGLDFVWENRKSIFKIMNNNSEFQFSGVNNTDENLIDKREFNVLLQFILKIYGDKNPSSQESTNYARILQINQIGAISDKKDFHSGLSNLGQKFVEIGFFNSTGNVDIFGEDRLRQYVINGYEKIEK